jgi:two-component system, cell cycle sensor histidine kinase and response regulator CckA
VGEWMIRLVTFLLGPHPRVRGNEDRRGARLFSGLIIVQVLLISAALFVINAVWVALEQHAIWSDPDGWVVMGGTVVLIAAYGLIRSGFYRPGAFLYIAVAAVVAVVAPFMDLESEIGLLATAVIPVFLAAIVLRYRWVIAILVVLTAAAAIQILLSGMPPARAGTGFSLVVVSAVAGALIIVFRAHFGALEQDRLAEIRGKEAEIAASEERLRALLASTQDVILVLDAAGVPRFAAGACREVFGVACEEIAGTPMTAVHPEDAARLEREYARFLESPGSTSRTEWRQRVADGRWRRLEAVASNRLGTPGVDGVVVSVRDVTERREAEENRLRLESQLQHAAKMESIGRLAGGVAHDFNNLLTAVIGNADLLEEEIGKSPLAGEELAEIRKAAGSAVSLTKQLLAFSRRQVVEPRVLDLNECIAPMHRMLSRLIGENIQLRTLLAPGVGAVRIDPGLLEQIIINLAVNARDAMPDGGTLVIETALRDVPAPAEAGDPFASADGNASVHLADGEAPGPRVELSVSDTGTGMTEDVLRHIFEPFFTTKPKGQGTGLGLATVYGAVKQSDGHIDVTSEPGRGSRFTIRLPRVLQDAEPQAPAGVPDRAVGGAETVLVVEDERAILDLAIRTLTRLGYQVLHSASAEDALEVARARRDPIHLLLTDVVLPGMNGRQLAAELAGIHPEARALFCSGYSPDVVANHGILDPGIAFLGKPYTMGELGRRVRKTLDEG